MNTAILVLSQRSLVDTFMHGAAWYAARRFMSILPLPVIFVVAAAAIFLYFSRKLRKVHSPK